MMIGIELVEDTDKTPAPKAAQAVKAQCRDAGLLVGVGGSLANVVRIQPPLVLTETEAAEVIDKVKAILTKVGRSV
jgi:4-aminobutyrate aminotransferase-like enzyme